MIQWNGLGELQKKDILAAHSMKLLGPQPSPAIVSKLQYSDLIRLVFFGGNYRLQVGYRLVAGAWHIIGIGPRFCAVGFVAQLALLVM